MNMNTVPTINDLEKMIGTINRSHPGTVQSPSGNTLNFHFDLSTHRMHTRVSRYFYAKPVEYFFSFGEVECLLRNLCKRLGVFTLRVFIVAVDELATGARYDSAIDKATNNREIEYEIDLNRCIRPKCYPTHMNAPTILSAPSTPNIYNSIYAGQPYTGATFPNFKNSNLSAVGSGSGDWKDMTGFINATRGYWVP